MRIKTTEKVLRAALSKVNKKYSGNIKWNRFDKSGNWYNVTLRCVSSKGPGHRVAVPRYSDGKQRNMISACWHAHGDFFDALIELDENVIIKGAGGTIFVDESGDTAGNWMDRNIGSFMEPFYHSEACEC